MPQVPKIATHVSFKPSRVFFGTEVSSEDSISAMFRCFARKFLLKLEVYESKIKLVKRFMLYYKKVYNSEDD